MSRTNQMSAITTPDDVVTLLNELADMCNESAAECTASWQDAGAGLPWAILAKHLNRAADGANRELLRRTEWGRKL